MNIISLETLLSQIGNSRESSEWIPIDQERINQFADVTEDHQFIHVDEEAAKATPFGGTIAHGFLTLSLLSKMAADASYVIEGIKAGVNYGFNKVRFINPVRAGKRVRGHFELIAHKESKPGTHVMTYKIEVEIEGEDKPALIAEWVTMQMLA
ncbi:MaoC family dehydratase [Parvularcula sp. ZS-1/3]|uniref:MaoC family dehydratase n=1 Tax=Parvularcula mediterranea TaxID=2732508 RepID=A0A7Y3RND1_9PROT|nr:MaoC family dehydratase [Parvularcula mediterranea]NNU16815.1 MaoC family dehydratase [Parvularcula mediterranea]